MTAKQLPGHTAPDGSEYTTLTDGAGNLVSAGGSSDATAANQTSQITQETAINTVLGVKTDAKSTATDTTSVSAISILKQISASVQAPASTAVTNAGTFATQSAQSGTWTVQPGNTANTTAWKVDGSAVTQPISATNLSTNIAQAAGTTLATGSGAMTAGTPRVALATDSPGIVTTGTAGSASATVLTVQGVASMTPVQVSQAAATTGGFSFLNIAAGQATTTVKSGAGTLHSIILNSAATATNVTTVYDNTAGSGTVIAIPAVTTATIPMTLLFDIAFATGLTIVTATANGGNMTICYK